MRDQQFHFMSPINDIQVLHAIKQRGARVEGCLPCSSDGLTTGGHSIEFMNAVDPHDGIGMVSGFEFYEFQRPRTIDEKTAARPAFLLSYPISHAVLGRS